MMRRTFLKLLGAVPFVKDLIPKDVPKPAARPALQASDLGKLVYIDPATGWVTVCKQHPEQLPIGNIIKVCAADRKYVVSLFHTSQEPFRDYISEFNA
jgi:hypothetical protein